MGFNDPKSISDLVAGIAEEVSIQEGKRRIQADFTCLEGVFVVVEVYFRHLPQTAGTGLWTFNVNFHNQATILNLDQCFNSSTYFKSRSLANSTTITDQ